jgi:cytoskeletal protein CcmA (bactofilin family)
MKKSNNKPQRDPSEVPTLIGANSSFEGEFRGSDSLCIEGRFQGRLETEGTVFINQRAYVQAEIYAQQVYVHGEILGNIYAQEHLNIGATGKVTGEVTTRSLTIATGGFLNGRCQMEAEQGTSAKQSGKLSDLFGKRKADDESNTQDLPVAEQAREGQAVATTVEGTPQADVLQDILQQGEAEEDQGSSKEK